jgi:serine/threonine-protein kinase
LEPREAQTPAFLVMEFVEGVDLAQRIGGGPMSVDEALSIARQLAEALEAAHDKGIVHRDLKPANIKVRDDGTVTVLDFGLAKALDVDPASDSSAMLSPTVSLHATHAGVILGTAAYMAPEQARGRTVDRRADIWAFGCVLYEMLAGARAFHGDNVTDILVAVVSKEPDWSALPANADRLRPLIGRCLRKDPRQRLQAIGDARVQLEELSSGAAGPSPAVIPSIPARAVGPMAIAGVMVTLAVLTMWIVMRTPARPAALTTRFSIVPPAAQPLAIRGADRDISVSPDGRNIVYRAGASGAVPAQLMIRAIDRLDSHVVPGTTNPRGPFFSFDSKWIGFFDEAALKKVPTIGGEAVTICRIASVPRGSTWLEDNTIVFATNDASGQLFRVSAAGGEPVPLTTIDATHKDVRHLFPSALPGGRGVLFTTTDGPNRLETAQIAVLDLRTGQQKVLLRTASDASYSETGHLVYAVSGTLRAVPFNLSRLEVTGESFPIADHVQMSTTGVADYALSRSGTLVYVQGSLNETASAEPHTLVWVDRDGRETPLNAPVRTYAAVRLSPDGARIAADIRDQENDIWIWDLQRQTLTRVTFDPGYDVQPLWTPDGRRIIFSSQRAGASNLYIQSADGTGSAERIAVSPYQQFATGISPDGGAIVGYEVAPVTGNDVVLWRLGTPDGQAHPLVNTPYGEVNPDVSSDGRYMAYESSESGRNEIYVRTFPNVNGGKWQVSTHGGTRPAWSRNGEELFFLDESGRLMTVATHTAGGAFVAGTPVKVFDANYVSPGVYRSYDVASDGRRFLMIKTTATTEPAARTMIVVLNWLDELKSR